MFTFGMFTTHIPYIALVAFYAYFMLFGMEKASKGEIIAESKNPFIIEIQSTNSIETNNTGCFYYQATDLFTEYSKFEEFIFKRKLNREVSPNSHPYCFLYSPATSNRPPPVMG
jgi:hypothetical protein